MLQKTINNIAYTGRLSLRQDELLAPIIYEMLKECPEAFKDVSENTFGLFNRMREGVSHIEALVSKDESIIDLKAIQENIESTHKSSIAIAMDLIKVNAWVYSKGYSKRIMAIILVPEGSIFDEAKTPALEQAFGEYADRETANDVISYFFQRSGVFGISMQAFLPKEVMK